MSDDATKHWAAFTPAELQCLWANLVGDTGSVAYRLRAEIYEALHPEPPTPEQRATAIVDFFHPSNYGVLSTSDNLRAALIDAIAAAIRADRDAMAAKDGTS